MKSTLTLCLTILICTTMLIAAFKPVYPTPKPCSLIEAKQLAIEAKMLQDFARHELEQSDDEEEDDTVDRIPLVIE
jgi:hypothetical protein